MWHYPVIRLDVLSGSRFELGITLIRRRVTINSATTFDKPVVRKAEKVFNSSRVLLLYAENSKHHTAFIFKGKQFKEMA